MPKGPNGQKRPADAIGCAVLVGKIATGEEDEVTGGVVGSAGGRARAEKLSAAARSEIAARAAKARWKEGESPELELKMTEQLSCLKKELFGAGSDISDIKFYPGESRDHSMEEIAGCIRAVLSSIEDDSGEEIDAAI
jgi:hypothetical protein